MNYKYVFFSPALDVRGNRRKCPDGYPGLSCRYCDGRTHAPGKRPSTGRYFPTTMKTMTDAMKTVLPMYDHLNRCDRCPPVIKKQLGTLFQSHAYTRCGKQLPHGGRRHFFRKLWNQIHTTPVDQKDERNQTLK